MENKMAKAEKKVKIKIERDCWPEEDKRVSAGVVIEVDEGTAKSLIDSGAATFVGVADEPAATSS
jgi:hypothetical protein